MAFQGAVFVLKLVGWWLTAAGRAFASSFGFSGRESASAPAFSQARGLHFHHVDGLGHMSTPGPVTVVKEHSVLADLSQPESTPGA